MLGPLSRGGTVPSYVFRYNVTESSIGMRKHGMLEFVYVCTYEMILCSRSMLLFSI